MVEASEAARARAGELGVNIEEVEGTGAGGNVKVSDVEAFMEAQEEPPPEPPKQEPQEQEGPSRAVILNPATGLGGYGFESGFEVMPGQSYLLTEPQYKEYRKDKHRGKPVIIEA